MGFADELRTATADEHRAAERSPFVGALFAGAITRDQYGRMLAELWFVYDALERTASFWRDDPVVGRFVFDELSRLAPLEADLDHFCGDTWRDAHAPSPAARAYRDRILGEGERSGAAFVAHHYTRYLGDLSGGQMMARTIQRTFELEGPDGLRFYRFDGVPDRRDFKARYREALDQAPFGPDDQAMVVREACLAFRLNRDLLDGLGQEVPVEAG